MRSSTPVIGVIPGCSANASHSVRRGAVSVRPYPSMMPIPMRRNPFATSGFRGAPPEVKKRNCFPRILRVTSLPMRVGDSRSIVRLRKLFSMESRTLPKRTWKSLGTPRRIVGRALSMTSVRFRSTGVYVAVPPARSGLIKVIVRP
jgi:hypothetical protein